MRIGIVSAMLALTAAPFILGAQSVIVPRSSEVRAEDAGVRSRTHFYIQSSPQSATPSGETPQSIRAVYNLPSTGGSGIIAIVDAFHYPTAEADLNVFSSQFGLPPCTTANGCFTQAFAYGVQPTVDCGWNQEAALDMQWAHAMAPNAKIVLVEAASNRNIDLYLAVLGASDYIAQHGGIGEVTMSWGGAEFAQEVNLDFLFTTPGIVYFASAGDTGSLTEYPSASPNVVAAGGTSIKRSSNGTFLAETAWTGSGGGISKYEPRPAYQAGVAQIVGTKRGIPDMSFDSDPATGVSVYTGFSCLGGSGWLVFGGTSVASPSLAGIVNNAGHFASSSGQELSTIYSNLGNATDFRDITLGFSFSLLGGLHLATPGYDLVTGVGSPLGLLGK
jgi:kumamolisin